MCLSEIKPLIDALRGLEEAQLQLVQWTESDAVPIEGRTMMVSYHEGKGLIERRIAGFEVTCRELGYNGPVRKVEPGDAVRLMEKRLTDPVLK